ncbi:MAG: BMP family ABC transporter substrate-binding protein [Firmicutes bacterium HGW-Firmicutes-16]|nr:MAG: BMP family ABC transporter substrate-binding protein [Firmicutes bacterium HGW-Firmicutes-16]
MKKRVKQILALTLSVVLALCCLSACGSASPDSSSSPAVSANPSDNTAPAEKMKVALILPGKKDDVSFNQAMYEGMNEYFNNHQDEVELKVVENMYETSEIEPTLIEYAEEGYDVIIGHGYQFTEPLVKVAKQYPDTYFLLGCGVDSTTNSAIYDVKLEAGGYLMGVIAALTTKTGKVGVIGGGEGAEITRGHEGFKAGAKSIIADIEIQEVYTGDWNDTAGAYEAAVSMYDSGVDVIWHSGDGIGLGVVQAAVEKDKYVLGNVEDQKNLGASNVLSGLQYEWGMVLDKIFSDIKDGSFTTKTGEDKTYWINIANGGLSMTDLNDTKGYLTQEKIDQINTIFEQLKNDEIELPSVEAKQG